MHKLRSLQNDSLKAYLEHCFDGVAVVTLAPCRLVHANPVLTGWLDGSAEALHGHPLEELFSPATRDVLLARVEQVARGEAEEAELTADLQRGPAAASMDVRLYRLLDGGEELVAIILRPSDERPDRSAPETERLDPLTGLPDRQFLFSRLATLLQGERAADRHFAVLFVDLDNFKQVNDAYGHLIGDRVLRELGQRLTACVREDDHVARYGGDEFVVLVEGMTGEREVNPIISRIDTALASPITLPEGEFKVSLSIGVAMASPDHHSPEDILREADRAMYAAKRVRD